MGVWYIAYNLGLTEKSYLLKISEGIHDEGAMKSGSSGFFWYELCVMMAAKQKSVIMKWALAYKEIGLPLIGYSANAPVYHVTYKITAIYFILHDVFGLLLQLFSTCKVVIRHLGWLSQWTCLSMPPEQLRREWGMMRHAGVSQRADGPRADCWQTGCNAVTLQPSSADCRRLHMNRIIIRHLPVRSAGILTSLDM